MSRENPNPALWRRGRVAINLDHVVATCMRRIPGGGDQKRFCVLFDTPTAASQRAGDVAVVEAFVPFPFDDETAEDFLRALEVYHSKA